MNKLSRPICKAVIIAFNIGIVVFLLSFTNGGVKSLSAEEDNNGKKDQYVLAFPATRMGKEVDAVEVYDILNRLPGDIFEKTGLKITTIKSIGTDFASDFAKGNIDFLFTGIDGLLESRTKGIKPEPLVLVSLFKKQGTRVCIYTNRDYGTLSNLKGVSTNVFGGGSPAMYVVTRKLLFENGIDMPLGDFFGDIYDIPFGTSIYQAFLSEKVQAIAEPELYIKVALTSVPQLKTLKPIACTQEYPFAGIFMRKGINSDDAFKLKEYLKKAHKSPILKEARTYIIATDAKFVEPDPALMERFEDAYKEAVKKGWFDEAVKFVEKAIETPFGQKIKPERNTYKECKEQCVNDKDREVCIEKCLVE